MTAAIDGTYQIWGAVFASVMTTVLAFYPMMTMTGIFGRFVKYIPMGVICALLISLLECYFILPYHIGRWVSLEYIKKPQRGFKKRFNELWVEVTQAYSSFLGWVMEVRWWVTGLFLLLLVSTLWMAKNHMKVILFPSKGIDQFLIQVKAPSGTSLDQTSDFIKPVEKELQKLPELKNFTTTVGSLRDRPDMPGERGSRYAQITVYLKNERERSRLADEIIEDLEKKFSMPENVDLSFIRIKPGPPVGRAVDIGVRGQRYGEILSLVKEIVSDLKKIPGVRDITQDYSPGKEQLVVRVDQKEASSLGLSTASVGRSVFSAFQGVVATSLKGLEEDIDIRVSLPESDKEGGESIQDLKILNPFNQLISLKSIADFSREKGVEFYTHKDNQRQVSVFAELDSNKISSLGVNRKIKEKEVHYKKKYPNLSLVFSGENRDTQESLGSLFRAFIFAVILIYFVLILTFQSFFWPIIIILVIPIGVISVLIALFLHGQPLSFMSMLGVVALAGVIINNSIVFVDFVIKNRKKGFILKESVMEAGGQRLRPIVLTTVTTVFGILPTAYGIGGVDPFVVPIAIALGWGIFLGAILSSIFLPAFIGVFDDIRRVSKMG